MSDLGSDVQSPRKLSLMDRLLGRVPPGSEEVTELLEDKTFEGIQEMAPRDRTTTRELGVESGSVLRLPDGGALGRHRGALHPRSLPRPV